MQQVNGVNVENLPAIGYYSSSKDRKEHYYATESHIHKQGPLSGLKAGAHKLTNDIFTYFPKGFAGSKNSDFYEFLSLGMVPYIVGSATLLALYGLNNKSYLLSDKAAADQLFKRTGAGVILFAVGKWLGPKLAHLGIKASTGIDLDLKYINKVNELPEPGQEKGMVRTQYPGVYDSSQFYRSDLLSKDSELNHGNMYYNDDKIAKKAGYKDAQNASNQIAGKKIREVKTRTTALENISKYLVATTGIALGFQKAFSDIKFNQPKTILKALKEGAIQLWQGTNRNLATKNFGKGLMIASAVSTFLTWLIPTIGFKTNPDTMKSKVNTKKEYEVC